LAIPLALFAWFLQRQLDSVLDRLGKSRALKRKTISEQQYHQARMFVQNRDLLYGCLFNLLLKIVFLGATQTIISGVASSLLMPLIGLSELSLFTQQLLTTIIATWIFRIAREGMSIYSGVAHFTEYEAEVTTKLGLVGSSSVEEHPIDVQSGT
jgi:hypothetical protein